MLPPLAELEALSERLGVVLVDDHDEPTSPDGVRALAALRDASALVRQEAGEDYVDDHEEIDWGNLSTGAVDVLQSVTIAAAYRAYRNPDGATQASVGDSSVSYSRQGVEGAVFLTEAEKRTVRRAVGKSTAGTVELVWPWATSSVSAYMVDVDGSEPMLFGPLPGDL
ncbi:MAG: hypothetical protein AB7L91_06315 [Dehalococcoidia bacterium]